MEESTKYNFRGIDKAIKGDFQAAIENFTKAISLHATYAEAYQERAKVYYNHGDLVRALADLDSAIRINRDWEGLYKFRAKVNYNLGSYDEALADYSKVIRMAKQRLANPSIGEQYHLEVMGWKDTPIRLYTEYGKVFLDRAELKMCLKNYTGARNDFRNAIKFDPDNPEIYLRISNIKYDHANFDCYKTIADLLIKALKLSIPLEKKALINEIKDFLQSIYRQVAERIGDGEISPYIPNKKESGYKYLDMSTIVLNNVRAVIKDLNKLINLFPDWAMPYFYRGYFRIGFLNEFKKAIQDYDTVIHLTPKDSDAYYNRGEAKYNLQDSKGAQADYKKAIKLNPNTGSYYGDE